VYGNYFLLLHLRCIWPNEVYVDELYDHTKPSMVVRMSSMQVYIEYMVILILYTTVIVLNDILRNMGSFEKFSHSKDLEYLNMSISTYLNL
jgi:hypothetical protein